MENDSAYLVKNNNEPFYFSQAWNHFDADQKQKWREVIKDELTEIKNKK